MSSQPKMYRKRSRGANLAILCAMAVMIIGFMGVSIYTGLQAFVESDLQRASMNAALVGAASYYSGTGSRGEPSPDAAAAMATATSTFNGIIGNSSMGGFGATLVGVTNNDSNDSITVRAQGKIATPLLTPLGINQIEVNTSATARALRYEPTKITGPLEILPVSTDPGSYAKVLNLTFPMVDGPGADLYIEQPAETQRGYIVEACNDTECYNITPNATPIGTSQILTVNGSQVIYGTVIIDLANSGVRKASKLRFTHANQFDSYNAGVGPVPDTATPTPTVIERVMIFGYSGACVHAQACSIPAGFMPVS